MLYTPKKFKYNNSFTRELNKLKYLQLEYSTNYLGNYIFFYKKYQVLTYAQLEVLRKSFTRFFLRKSKVIRHITLTQPITKKSKHSRMGKGKGKFFKWIGFLYPGKLIFEVTDVSFYNLKKTNKHFYFINKLNKKISGELKIIKNEMRLSLTDLTKLQV